jgi:hypothetical protein
MRTPLALQDTVKDSERIMVMEDTNALHGVSKVRDVRPVRGGAPSAEASKLLGYEVCVVTSTLSILSERMG